MTDPYGEHSELVELRCSCCHATYRLSRHNQRRIARAVALRWPEATAALHFKRIPADVDLTGPVSAYDIRRVVEAAVDVDDAG